MTEHADSIDSLDDTAITVVRRLDGPRPSPGRIRYALRRAQAELDPIGLQIVIRPKAHGRAPRRRTAPPPPLEVVANAQVAVNDGAVSIAPVARAEPSMSIATVREALRLNIIGPDDVPRFLGGRTLDEAIAQEQAAADRLLDADGVWNPPAPSFVHRHPIDDPQTGVDL